MKDKIAIIIIIFISICLSLSLGMLDYETESLYHLLTSDKGNIPILVIFAMFFTGVGLGFFFMIKYIRRAMRKKA